MNLCDKLVKKLHGVEAIRAEMEIIEKMLLNESYTDDEHEDSLRLRRIVKQGQIEVFKRELKLDFNRYLKK